MTVGAMLNADVADATAVSGGNRVIEVQGPGISRMTGWSTLMDGRSVYHGRVAINREEPTATLDVDGDARIGSMRIKNLHFSGRSTGGEPYDVVLVDATNPGYRGFRGSVHVICNSRGVAKGFADRYYWALAKREAEPLDSGIHGTAHSAGEAGAENGRPSLVSPRRGLP